MRGAYTQRARTALAAISLIMASAACNLVAAQPDTSATGAGVDETITAQAGIEGGAATRNPLATERPPGGAGTPGLTPTASETPTPSITPTPPDERSSAGPTLGIPRCELAINVDGTLDDWLDQPQGFVSIALDKVTFGANNRGGAGDLSGTARLCWTSGALYVAVEVTDDALVQTQRGQTQWRGDEVELVFDGDLRGDFYEDVWDDDDIQLGLSPGNFGDVNQSAVRYHPGFSDQTGITLGVRRPIGSGGNYIVEAAIPWAALGITPQADGVYGLCAALSDNDRPGEAVQESMVSHCTDLRVTDPTTWASARLLP